MRKTVTSIKQDKPQCPCLIPIIMISLMQMVIYILYILYIYI